MFGAVDSAFGNSHAVHCQTVMTAVDATFRQLRDFALMAPIRQAMQSLILALFLHPGPAHSRQAASSGAHVKDSMLRQLCFCRVQVLARQLCCDQVLFLAASVCVRVCLFVQNVENYESEIGVTC